MAKRRSSGEKRKHRFHPKKYSVLETVGILAGGYNAATSAGQYSIMDGGPEGLAYRMETGITGYNPEYGFSIGNAAPTYIPVVAGFIAEKILQKLGMNVKLGKRWKL